LLKTISLKFTEFMV